MRKAYLINSVFYNNYGGLRNSEVVTVNNWVRGSSPCWEPC